MSTTRALIAALLLCIPASASAQTIEATSLTLLAGRADPRDGEVHTIVPAYEDVWLSARDLDVPGMERVKIVVSGWGMLAAGETFDDEHFTGDLDLAFVEASALGRHLALRLGRQLVSSGVARNLQLDGLDAAARIVAGVGVEVYGGVPVAPRFGYARGQGAVGGRLFWRPSPIFEGGASAVVVLDDGLVAREELGADARLVVGDKVTLAGLAAFSPVEARLSEASLRALWQATRNLELTLEGARTAPDLFVSRASIFSVFAEETRDELGATLYLRPLPAWRIWADGYAISDESGTGARGGLRNQVSVDKASEVGVEGRVVAIPASRYLEARLYGLRRFGPRLTATLDCDAVWLDPAMNGRDRSLTFAGTLGWDFLPGWRAVATGLTGQTPLLAWRVEAMAKLVYNFDHHVRKEVR